MTRGFSFNRLAQVLRWDVAAGWRGYMAGLWAVASILLLMFVVDMRYIDGDLTALTDADSMHEKATMAFSGFVFAMVCGASLAAMGLGDKSRRAAFFMLPATQLEKFVARCLLFTVGLAFMFVVAVAVADALYLMFCLFVGTTDGLHSVLALFAGRLAEAVSEPFVQQLDPGESNVVFGIYSILAFVWLQSLMLVGSVLFSRWQFALTSMVLIVSYVILGFALYPQFREPVSFTFFEVAVAVLPVLIVAHYALAYRLFRRMQLVGRKWINI